MPFINKQEYKIFTFGKTYIVNDECIDKVKNIDSYRSFIWSNRPYIWMPILIISAIISGLLSYLLFHNFNHLRTLIVWVAMGIYSIVSIIFYLIIRKAINCTSKEVEE